jgi:hypothetical protein
LSLASKIAALVKFEGLTPTASICLGESRNRVLLSLEITRDIKGNHQPGHANAKLATERSRK